MALINVCGELVEVCSIGEFARGPDGLCAFCHGDPCNERPTEEDTPIKRFYKENEWANTCPCCDGRPS